ncbi:MAG: methionyl-tRNA formyltransferase [Flavobacteriales bacterium]|nr:methionyl-tRNA formyltransferase [Flavobacteriales bacterium]
MSSSTRIVFMGTPEFAVSSLNALVEHGFHVVGVITSPDKAAGRGQRIHESAVKKYALEHDLPLLQPTNLKDPDFQERLAALKADIQIVVAFRMLPESVWNMPPKGTVNLHASLLPNYRGAAPINWAVMNGDTATGLTTFFIEKEIDTGKVIFQEKMAIPYNWTAGQLHDELMVMGGALLVKTVKAIESGFDNAIDQKQMLDIIDPLPAPKIFKEHCKINWQQPTTSIYNHIRGLSPYPAAWCELVSPEGDIHQIKLFKCEEDAHVSSGTAGAIKTDGKKLWTVACADGDIRIEELQLAGKKRMHVGDFLRGFNLTDQWKLQ